MRFRAAGTPPLRPGAAPRGRSEAQPGHAPTSRPPRAGGPLIRHVSDANRCILIGEALARSLDGRHEGRGARVGLRTGEMAGDLARGGLSEDAGGDEREEEALGESHGRLLGSSRARRPRAWWLRVRVTPLRNGPAEAARRG